MKTWIAGLTSKAWIVLPWMSPRVISIDAVSQEIERRFKDSQNISLQTTEAFKKSILDLVDQSFRLFDVLNLIGVIIGALSVINTLTMNVIERQREIGGLRSLGMTRRQVLRMVLAEALALGLMGGVYGFVIGYFIAQVVILGTNRMAGYDLVYQFTPRPLPDRRADRPGIRPGGSHLSGAAGGAGEHCRSHQTRVSQYPTVECDFYHMMAGRSC